jgi:beta-glucosidase
MFDPPESVPFADTLYEVNDCAKHRKIALGAARKSIVLLKNQGGLLPISRKIKSIAVIGSNANDRDVLLGNYNGIPSRYVTILEGIRRKLARDVRIYYAQGCKINETKEQGHIGKLTRGFAEAVACAQHAEAVIMALGLNSLYEGEEGDATESPAGGDRTHLNLPGKQQELLEAVCATDKPVVLSILNGSPIALNWAQEHVPAILEAWYPGEEGGTAIADVIFGDYNPGGRLPITFPRSIDQLPPFEDYTMNGEKGRTYRYMRDEPLYPFGYGLSYTRFEYSDLTFTPEIKIGQKQFIWVAVKNIGNLAGEEVVQIYLSYPEHCKGAPIRQLRGFKRISLKPGQRKTVSFKLTPRLMAQINDEGRCVLEPGTYMVYVGGSQPDKRSEFLTGTPPLSSTFIIKGHARELKY